MMRSRPQNIIADANERHPEDPVSLDEVLDMLRLIAKDYASIGSIFSYMARTSGATRVVPVHTEPGYYVKPEVIESMQQELAALTDSTALLQRDVKVNQAQ